MEPQNIPKVVTKLRIIMPAINEIVISLFSLYLFHIPEILSVHFIDIWHTEENFMALFRRRQL